MNLLLDEMHAPAAAAQLRARGHDAVPVKERPELIGLADRELFVGATAEGRAVVTENVKDFAALHKSMTAIDERHAGLIFTHPRRFPRHAATPSRHWSTRLAGFLDVHASTLRDIDSFVWWLERPQK